LRAARKQADTSQMIIRHSHSWLLVALLFCFGAAQAATRIDMQMGFTKRAPLVKVVEELDERHMAVDTVGARLAITLFDLVKNKEYELQGAYLGDKNGNMRLRITAPGGQLVLDMAVCEEDLEVALPRKNRFFRGKRQEVLSKQSCQLSLLAHAGGARDLFFPRAWSDAATERRVTYRNGREVVSVIEKPGRFRRPVRRLIMAPDSPMVESVEVFDFSGREVGTLKYSDYRFGEEATKGNALGLANAGKITLQCNGGTHKLEMRVEELWLNAPIPENRFKVPVPENCKLLDLGEALKRSGELWDN